MIIRDFPKPRDPYLPTPRTTALEAARVERELGLEDGIDQAARFMLGAYQQDLPRVVQVLRRWARETGNLRWGLVADHLEAMPASDARA